MSWVSPFSLPGKWFKGNVHTHTTASDGRLAPAEAAAWYRAHGYDFVAITDHNVATPGRAIADDFITVSGAEMMGPGYHLLALGISELPYLTLAESPAALVQSVNALGGLAFFAHPYWSAQTSASISAVADILGIEVFNSVCEQTRGLGYSQVHWDECLARGGRVWGLAVDDTHWKYDEEGQGYIVVKAATLDEVSLLAAMRAGQFYASTGPTIEDLRIVEQDGQMALQVQCSPCQFITFHAIGAKGRRYMAPEGGLIASAAHPLKPDQVYLRVQCQSPSGGIAWSNPVFVADVL